MIIKKEKINKNMRCNCINEKISDCMSKTGKKLEFPTARNFLYAEGEDATGLRLFIPINFDGSEEIMNCSYCPFCGEKYTKES